MLDKSSKRRPWSDEGKRQLIEYWDSVRSTVLISLMLDCSPSSIQTQASRLGLPRRSEESDRHRRRWTRRDREDLDDIVRTRTLPQGKIQLEQVAERVGGSVDAVASRLFSDLAKPDDPLVTVPHPTR